MRSLVLFLFLLATSTPLSAQWPTDPSANLPVSTIPYVHSYPDAVSDGSGGVIAVWEDFRSGSNSYDIYAQRVSIAGAILWTLNGVAVTSAPSEQTVPRAVIDGEGGAIVVWLHGEGSGQPDIFAQRITSSGSMAWAINGVPVCNAADAQTEFDLVADGSGGVIVTWMDRRNGAHNDIYAQRLGSAGNALWTANGVLLCGAIDDQEFPRVVEDGAGGASIVWVDHRGASADIFGQRLDATGNTLWSAGGVPICVASGSQQVPTPIPVLNSPGTLVVSWVDERNPTTGPDIFAQRVSGVGVPQWLLDGIPVCTALGYQSRTASLSMSDGSVVVCWPDARNDSDDLYASRIDQGGSLLWGTNGVPVCVAANSSWEPQITHDGIDGVIITWADDRSNQFVPDIYAQRLNSSGADVWTDNGVVVSSAGYDQHRARIVADNAGGAIITWEDWRDGGLLAQRYKIFAQRIGPDGALGTPTSVGSRPTPEFEQLDVSPNPFTRQTTLSVRLDRPSGLLIEVFDVAGRQVMRQSLPELPAGTHRVPLVIDRHIRAASGVYLCRVSASYGSRTAKLVIAR